MLMALMVTDESLDAHLLWFAARVIGIAGIGLIFFSGDIGLGPPRYGILAGLGFGGLAVALPAPYKNGRLP